MPVRWDEIDVDGSKMRVYVGVPDAPRCAGVLVCHHGPGMDAFMLDVVHRLFRRGYAVAAPDLYHRQPADVTDTYARMGMLSDEQIVTDMDAGLAHLRGLSECAVGPVGVTGFCMGGRTAFMMAGVRDDLAAAAVFYGGRMKTSFGTGSGGGDVSTTPFDLLAQIRCPVVGFFGDEDADPSPADVDALSAELARHARPHEFHRYRDAGHAFLNFTNPQRYRPRAAAAAWAEMLAFFGAHLRP
ncbi:MAG TPA: dienelactone hydrolase family protein [Kofleriaceae bacterium]|nr:dienelactone hydrolase family protein [Kofleriaceae bacterium]